MKFGKRIRIKEIVKGVCAFCSYLFVPQWGGIRNTNGSRLRVNGDWLMVKGYDARRKVVGQIP